MHKNTGSVYNMRPENPTKPPELYICPIALQVIWEKQTLT